VSEETKRAEPGTRRSNLGRGLSALFGDVAANDEPLPAMDKLRPSAAAGSGGGAGKPIPIEFLRPGRYQPRRHFDEDAIQGLVESIREKGVLQPLLARRDPDNPARYEIIAGERRWRAAQLAGLHELPVIVRELSDRDALEISLIENIQRQDLNPLEEAEGYRRLIDEFKHTQDALGKALGKSRSHIANTLRLLALPEAIKALVLDGTLTAGHARALLTAADPAALALKVVHEGLNVRQTEELVRESEKPKKDSAAQPSAAEARDVNIVELEREITARIGLKVAIATKGKDGKTGTLTIHYKSLDQFDDLLRRLNG